MTIAPDPQPEALPRYSCPISGQPLVRKITFEDSGRSAPHQVPAHITSRFLLDGEAPDSLFIGHAEVLLVGGDATVVVLYALAEDVCPPFEPSDPAEGRFAPAAIGGHVFLAPYEPWVKDEEKSTEGCVVVRCPVYVAEVEVR